MKKEIGWNEEFILNVLIHFKLLAGLGAILSYHKYKYKVEAADSDYKVMINATPAKASHIHGLINTIINP